MTTKIPNDLPCAQIMTFIEQVIQNGAKSIQVDIHSFGEHRLIICTNINLFKNLKPEEELIYLETLFTYLTMNHLDIELILNLREPHLENRVKVLIDKWGLKKQVYYCGKVNPGYLTPWDRPYILYNIENCLPNVYTLGDLKRAHFDVIHYFCNKYKVKTIRLHAKSIVEDIICWANDVDLKLAVYGVDSFEEAQGLKEAGIDRVTVSDSMVTDALLVNE